MNDFHIDEGGRSGRQNQRRRGHRATRGGREHDPRLGPAPTGYGPGGSFEDGHPHGFAPGGGFDGGEPTGFGPRGAGPGRRGGGHRRGGPGGPGPHGRRGPRRRGDVRMAVLHLLAESEEPMHGYQLMQTIAERTGGAWRPSPGAVYPTLSQLEDEGLVTIAAEGDRKAASLTDAGRAYVEENRSEADPFERWTTDGVDLRDEVRQLTEAARTIVRSGSDEQQKQTADILATARKDIYRLLAGE